MSCKVECELIGFFHSPGELHFEIQNKNFNRPHFDLPYLVTFKVVNQNANRIHILKSVALETAKMLQAQEGTDLDGHPIPCDH